MKLDKKLQEMFTKIMRKHISRFHKELIKIGMHPGQPHLLHCLKHKDGKMQKDLAKLLQVQPATMTKMIKRLEKEGMVIKRNDEQDGRIARIYITKKGREFELKTSKLFSSYFEEMFSPLNEKEKEELFLLLNKIDKQKERE